jgi:glutamine synthetase
MTRDELAAVVTSDIAAHCRGRAFRAQELPQRLESGTGWVPANLAIGPFEGIVTPNSFGALGDLILRPDASSVTHIPAIGESTPWTVALADIVQPNGQEWEGCPRTFLRRALQDLEERTGWRMVASFEHEFMVTNGPDISDPPFSLRALRNGEPLGSTVMAVLEEAGLQPEMWLPEYGADQWEITTRPADALVAADRAVLLREIIRDVARTLGTDITFAPILDPAGSGNGVHIHFSFEDEHGRPVMFEPGQPGDLALEVARFAAGVLAHGEALLAITAPSVVSYARLAPHRWSTGHIFLGQHNREAFLRICPTQGTDPADVARQYNLEFRASDATANPWLSLGAIVRAGLQGLEDGLEPAPVIVDEVDDLSDEARGTAGIKELPTSLSAALDHLEMSKAAAGWLGETLHTTFLQVKRREIELLSGLSVEDQCARYAGAY